jgi:hypothetical protein
MYFVPAVTPVPDVGMVTVPTPVPSEPMGKVEVPVNVIAVPPVWAVAIVTVNSASWPETVPLSAVKPATVTCNAPPGLIVVGDSVTDFVVRANEESDTPTKESLSVAVNTIVLLTPEPDVVS